MEEEILIIGCDSEDEIESTCSDTSEDQLSDGRPQWTSASEQQQVGGEADSRPGKRRRADLQTKGLTLGQELAFTDLEPEPDNDDQSQKETFKKKRGKMAETSDHDVEDSKATDIGHAIYSLGNHCPRMLRGVPCTKARCSWVHYMVPSSAVSQLYRVLANRCVKYSSCFKFNLLKSLM